MKIKMMIFPLTMIIFLSVVLAQYIKAASDGTLPSEATVPTTQSTVGMDGEEESDEKELREFEDAIINGGPAKVDKIYKKAQEKTGGDSE